VEAKITEMGILFSTEYRVTFILDRSSMPRVEDHHYYKRKRDSSKSEVKYYEIKPLQLIWDKVPGFYNAKNTIHVDDLSRNFIMNQRNGLKISAYKNAHQTYRTDRELLLLGYYLVSVKDCEDFQTLNLNGWRDHILQMAGQAT
jgi:ubiquitin-like domain-containing CTD phosphatase 1